MSFIVTRGYGGKTVITRGYISILVRARVKIIFTRRLVARVFDRVVTSRIFTRNKTEIR